MRSNTAPQNLIKLHVYPPEIKKNIYFFKKRHLFYSDRGMDKRKRTISFADNISLFFLSPRLPNDNACLAK